jgi:diadenylate cyclase
MVTVSVGSSRLDHTLASLAQVDLSQGVRSFIERVMDRPWVALIELLLIGCVVYTVLRFLQGTRGVRLVRAVITILAVSFAIVWLIAERFEFERINVLYSYFILGVFLVSLVAFQPELRRILLRLGEGGWLQRWMRSSEQSIEPIVTAVERLSKKKIGALIAIERGTGLGAVTEGGVQLDAVVTTELLETIFWPGTALHDLGVIIHQDRVVAAGCQFPLAESGEVDRSLGSRHRAAIGMSHECDAVVIVVSEETGTVSVAFQGRLRRGLSSEALQETLVRELTSEPPRKSPPKRTAASARKAAPPVSGGEVKRDGTGKAA